jgi:Tol biopolymer transport system component
MIRRLLPLLLLATVADAASYPPSYRWETITTAHFYVHFHQGEEELARRAAGIAESVHARLAPMMRWTPRGRTHVILTDNVDVSNGSATPFPNNRIEVYVSAPGGDPESPISYYDDWLDLVITHEYTHILHLDQAHGLPGVLRTVFGRTPLSFPNALSPLWMTEGLATFVESELTDAGRVKGTFVEMVLRAAAIEANWPTEAQAGGLSPEWPGGSARYFFGSKFMTWLARRYGNDALARYFNEYSGRLIPFRHNATAEHVFGKELSTLWDEWTAEQRTAYAAEYERLQTAGLTRTTRLTDLGYETQHPVLAPDGARIAYTHYGPYERPTIRVWDVAAGHDVATHAVNTTSTLSWSPDGKSIAYADLEYVGSFSVLSDLYVWDVGTRRERRITHGSRLKHPAFTPDGRALLAVQNRAGRNAIVEVDLASGALRTLVLPAGTAADATQFSDIDVSGDRFIVAEWNRGRIDVVIYARDGRRLANLTESLPRSTNAAPRFMRNGAVVFSSDVTGISNVFVAENGSLRRVTNVYGGAFFPASVDGETLWFAEYHSHGFDLARASAGSFDVVPRGAVPALGAVRAAAEAAAAPPPSPYRALSSALPRWWSPVIGDGTFGVTTSGGDVLGFHQYALTLTNDGHSIVYSYDRLYPTLTVASFRFDDDLTDFYTDTQQRLVAQVSVPFQRFERQLSAYAGVIRDEYRSADAPLPGVFRGTLQGVRVGGVFNNARTFGYSISPEQGVTALVDYENLRGDARVQQTRADIRGYLSLPWRRSPLGRHVLAVRAAGGHATGDFVFQRELRVGGAGMGEFLGLDVRHFPVRGYETSTLRGMRAAIGSIEYRLPIWNIDRGPSLWPFFFQRIVGDVFVDAGTAWQPSARRTIASAGAEVSLDVFLSYAVPLRYRAGVAYLLREPGKGTVQPYVVLETSF